MSKKLEQELREKLKAEERKQRIKETNPLYENKLAEAAVMFFGTLIPLYILFYIAHSLFMLTFGLAIGFFSVNMNWIYTLIHGAIWAASVISVYRKRSVLDDMMKRL
jgi:hypothetical protein